MVMPRKYHSDEERLEARRAYSRNYNKTDKGKIALSRAYEKYAEKKKIKVREWYQENKEKVFTNTARRRGRLKQAKGNFTVEDTKQIRKYQGDVCNYCKVSLENLGHLDHIKPISKGGSNWPCNLQWLCPTCNLKKGSKWPITEAFKA